jgi:hypothetical protein
MPGYENVAFADEWRAELNRLPGRHPGIREALCNLRSHRKFGPRGPYLMRQQAFPRRER